MRKVIGALLGSGFLVWLVGSALSMSGLHQPIIPNLPMKPNLSASTVPSNGDLNPYGVAFVPNDFSKGGKLNPGDIIVSNFNNNTDTSGTQGTGSTIVDINQQGMTSLFFQGNSQLGLTTALGILGRGFVIVGSLPSPTGTCTQVGDMEQGVEQGSLLILDRNGNQVSQLSDSSLLDGPWDLTVLDEGTNSTVFVSDVLKGTVTRLELNIPNVGNSITVQSSTQIASGYLHRCDSAALVVGPTGLAYDVVKDILYVASTGDNAVFAIPHARRTQTDAGKGTLIYQDATHLHGPLGMGLAPNGDLIAAQGDAVNPDASQPSEIVEFTPAGQFVSQFSVDSSSGSAFGLAVENFGNIIQFAAVDDGVNMLKVWTIE